MKSKRAGPRVLLAALAVLAACRGPGTLAEPPTSDARPAGAVAPPAAEPAEPDLAVDVRARVEATRSELERWRGRSFLRPVEVEVVAADPKSSLAGWYDPGIERLVVVEGRSLAFARGVLLHELFHALQDQHFDLQALRDAASGDDELQALRALIEGEAMLAVSEILGYDFERHAVLPASGEIDRGRFDSIYHYRDGMRFVRALRERGGWAAVDAAFARPPRSSAEILHPERYPAPEPAALDLGWSLDPALAQARIASDQRKGEIALRWLLAAHEPTRAQADEIAAELESDRARVFESDDPALVRDVWDLRFSDSAGAARFVASEAAQARGWELVAHRGRDVRLQRAHGRSHDHPAI